MAEPPVIQVLEKADYTNQHIVSLPDALPLPALAPDSVRVRSRIISLTVNNLSYARLGDMLGWYDVHPLPASTPTALNDSSKFGRISAWGYGEVIESTLDALPVGRWIYGYLPIGTLPVDLRLAPAAATGHFVETSGFRQHVMPIYNRFWLLDPDAGESEDSLGMDSLVQPVWQTSYLLNRFSLAWDPQLTVHPSGAEEAWSANDADVTDAVVVLLAASAKTALSLAQQFQQARPNAHRPRAIVGVTSARSKRFVEETAFYDSVFTYDQLEADGQNLPSSVAADSSTKIVLLNFGAPTDAAMGWHKAAQGISTDVKFVALTSEAKVDRPGDGARFFELVKELGWVLVNASGMRSRAYEVQGEQTFFDEFLATWQAFKDGGGVPGLQLQWREGMDEVGAAWERLCKGEVSPTTGLLFRL